MVEVRVLACHAVAVGRQVVAVGMELVGDVPGAIGVLAKRQAGFDDGDVVFELFVRGSTEQLLFGSGWSGPA